MSDENRPMLSLLAQNDDINRITEKLTCGFEEECIQAVQAQFYHLQSLHIAQREIENKNNDIVKLKKENGVLNTRLKHARSLIETEMKKRLKIEEEKQSLERQIALIKDVLLTDQSALNDNAKEKLAFLSTLDTVRYRTTDNISPRTRSGEVRAGPFDEVNLATIEESIGSLLSPSDISFDKTDDDLDSEITISRSRSKRGSSSSKKAYSKKPKLYDFLTDEQECATVSSSESPFYSVSSSETKVETVMTNGNKRSKYPSEPAPVCNVRLLDHKSKSESEPNGVSFKDVIIPETPDRNSMNSTGTPYRRFSSTGKLNRNHVFVSKVLIRPEKCHPCGEKIQYFKQALKCSECRLTCHPECKDKALPCYPSTPTPSAKVGMMNTISDYTPTIPPMIPAILVHCINEIESRGLEQVGIYRVSGSEREVKELKEKFLKGKLIPSLNKNDIHAICGCVKEFLRSLREPLVTRKLWKNFVNAAESDETDLGAVYEVINNLPQPNRDTLAFLINHLHIVAESPQCLMPIENLSKVFAPTVIGYSVMDPVAADMLSETRAQNKVMKLLLDIPVNFWRSFICSDNVFKSNTPETLSIHSSNRLGPITRNTRSAHSGSSYQSGGVVLAKTALTPRNENPGQRRQKKSYFASPLLK